MNFLYELLDSGQNADGQGEKLERFGEYSVRRPDPEVLWQKRLSNEVWDAADATFIANGLSKKWQLQGKMKEVPPEWIVEIGGLQYKLALGTFKHVGIFPEQVQQWQWMTEKIQTAEKKRTIKVLNLFGYTGGATCALARAGAEVTHVDALETNLSWTKENLALNGLADAPVRLIADDVRKFVEREIRRGAKYDGIVMDPPVYGKGDAGKNKKRSKKSEWRLEEDLLPLLAQIKQLLSDDPVFWVISGYASEYSALSYANALSGILAHLSTTVEDRSRVTVESGELTIAESSTHPRLLPAGIFARTDFTSPR